MTICYCTRRIQENKLTRVRAFVKQIYHELQKTWRQQSASAAAPTVSSKNNDDIDDDRSAGDTADPRWYRNQPNPQYTLRTDKGHRLQEARKLLRNMTQSTLELADWQSVEALRGYTREKFIECASLVVKSLGSLRNVQKGHYHRTGTTQTRCRNTIGDDWLRATRESKPGYEHASDRAIYRAIYVAPRNCAWHSATQLDVRYYT